MWHMHNAIFGMLKIGQTTLENGDWPQDEALYFTRALTVFLASREYDGSPDPRSSDKTKDRHFQVNWQDAGSASHAFVWSRKLYRLLKDNEKILTSLAKLHPEIAIQDVKIGTKICADPSIQLIWSSFYKIAVVPAYYGCDFQFQQPNAPFSEKLIGVTSYKSLEDFDSPSLMRQLSALTYIASQKHGGCIVGEIAAKLRQYMSSQRQNTEYTWVMTYLSRCDQKERTGQLLLID